MRRLKLTTLKLRLTRTNTHVHACAALGVSVTTQSGGRSIDVLRVSYCFDLGPRQA